MTTVANSVEIAPGVLVVFYSDGQVEIASNCEFSGRKSGEDYGGPGNVFMPIDVFHKLQEISTPRRQVFPVGKG